MFIKTDGGKDSAGFTHESNDCVVRAISIAYCTEYEKIHAALHKLGRKEGKGISTRLAMQGREFIWHKSSSAYAQSHVSGNVGAFIKANPVGHYVVRVRGHALAVIDGVIHDSCLSNSLRCFVVDAWKVL
jgi:hypothetical protein